MQDPSESPDRICKLYHTFGAHPTFPRKRFADSHIADVAQTTAFDTARKSSISTILLSGGHLYRRDLCAQES
jgi:hypothetical protein